MSYNKTKSQTKATNKKVKFNINLDSINESTEHTTKSPVDSNNLDTIMNNSKVKEVIDNVESKLNNMIDYQTDSFEVCDAYFGLDNGKQIIAHHFKSFEQFIDKYINDIFAQFNPVHICQEYDNDTNKYKFELFMSFENYYFKTPTITEMDGETIDMTPNIAKLRNLTYSSQLYVNIRLKRVIRTVDSNNPLPNLDIEDVKEMVLPDIKFGKIPIMVQSKYCVLNKLKHVKNSQLGECEFDLGGYFIINGNEKVIVGQERIAGNKIFVFNQQKQNKAREFESEVRSCKDNSFSVVMTNIVKFNEKNRIFTIDIPTFKNPINIFIIMKLCGIKNDKDLLELICYDIEDDIIGKEIAISLKQTLIQYKNICIKENIKTDDDLEQYCLKQMKMKQTFKEYKMTAKDKHDQLYKSLEDDFLPHCGNDLFHKGYYVGLMTRKLILVMLKILPYDDRDSFENKRVETTGHLLAGLFRQCMTRLIKEIQKNINKELNNKNILKNLGANNGKNIDIFDIINSDNIYKIIKVTSIESGIKYSLATGNWGVKTNGVGKQKVGTAQVLSRLGYNSYLSYLRRVICPSDKKKKNSKIVGPRKLHSSQFGYICPAETPEGSQVGIVKNMALSATITNHYDSNIIKEWLLSYDIKPLPRCDFNINTSSMNLISRDTLIFINGDIIGYHSNIKEFIDIFYNARRTGAIHPYISIRWNIDINECTIYTDAGRLIRPLYVVNNGTELAITKDHIKLLKEYNYDFNVLVMPNKIINSDYNTNKVTSANNSTTGSNNSNKGVTTGARTDINIEKIKATNGVIDFIDNEELNNCTIAVMPEYLIESNKHIKYLKQLYSHCEIHPGLMLGVLACVIPFSDHSQSPRNAYQSSMGKQAMSIYLTNYLKRLDTQSYILNNIEKSLVRSNFGKYVNYSELPPGMNAMVAISCYAGYNQEDSVILNGNSVDMGMFRTTYYHVYKDEEKKIQSNGKEEKFCKPDPVYTKGIKPGNYDKLDERGFIKVNEFVSSKDVIIGKKLPVKNKYKNGEQIYEDCSTSIRMNETGFVDNVYVHRNESGYMCGKVRIRNERVPSIGSKFASRVGQKGTVGMILPQESMPFTKDGLVPDIIMTPHAIPSRMTIGQLLETLLGKISAHCGGFTSCTPFDKVSPDTLGKILESHGYDYCGNEVLYSGITGKQMDVMIFFGPTYYQRLKHMVEDKMHCITSDHEVLTDSGWKYFQDIDIERDKLYTMEFQPTTLETYNENMKFNTAYKHAIDRHYYPNREQELYHIKNDYIDTIITSEHRLPVRFQIGDDNAHNEYFMTTIEALYNSMLTKKLDMYTDKYSLFINNQTLIDVELDDITKLPKKVETTFCFTMPDETFYVRRNGKEYWTGNSRSSGPVVLLTRQPAEGRARDGGLRIGEMEKDVFNAHGTLSFMKERLMDVSDKFDIYVCSHCGNQAIVNTDEEVQKYECNVCDNYSDFKYLQIPYAQKLMMQELQGMYMNVTFET
jgi:DNA-directed RNA polymerase II subunit RPB2